MTKNAKLSRQMKAQLTRKKIMDAAYALFAQEDIQNVSVEMITKKAGVAKGSFYVHFQSKDILVAMIAEDKIGEVDTIYEDYISSMPKDINTYETLLLLSLKIIDVMVHTLGRESLTLTYKLLLSEDAQASAVVSYSRKIYSLLENIIERGIEKNEIIGDYAPSEIAEHILLALRGLTYQWCALSDDFNIERETRIHMKILLNGICK